MPRLSHKIHAQRCIYVLIIFEPFRVYHFVTKIPAEMIVVQEQVSVQCLMKINTATRPNYLIAI
jgi:hypothetical protein